MVVWLAVLSHGSNSGRRDMCFAVCGVVMVVRLAVLSHGSNSGSGDVCFAVCGGRETHGGPEEAAMVFIVEV